jgi:hypothetical protein
MFSFHLYLYRKMENEELYLYYMRRATLENLLERRLDPRFRDARIEHTADVDTIIINYPLDININYDYFPSVPYKRGSQPYERGTNEQLHNYNRLPPDQVIPPHPTGPAPLIYRKPTV